MTTALATSALILDAEFDQIRFEARLEDDHLVLEGVLADQEQLDAIPVGIYVMERDGTVVACNTTAVAAWGRAPELNADEKFCGAFRLRYPSGDVMPHHQAPPAVALNNGGTVRNADVICEQPDGTRLLALVNVFPIRDADDQVIGAVNVFRHNTDKTVPGLAAG
jgi:PAS domain-containing protein